MRRAYVFRLRPTARQHVTLASCVDGHRELYNAALQERRDAWAHSKTRINYGDRKGELVGLFFKPAAAEFMCRVGPIRQRHDDVGVHQNHDERSATEAVREQLVHPLG
jgi:hypothetical protein